MNKKLDFTKLTVWHKIMVWLQVVITTFILVGVCTGILNYKLIVLMVILGIIWTLVTSIIVITAAIK